MPDLNFRPCRCLKNGEIVILDMDKFKWIESTYWKGKLLACEYLNDDDELEHATIWNGNIDEPSTHTFLHDSDSSVIMSAFFRARVSLPDWSLDDSIVCMVDELEFVIMSDDPDHIVAWVNTSESDLEPLHSVHLLRTKQQ